MSKDEEKVYAPDGKVLTEYFWDRGYFCCIQGPIGSGTSTASCHRIWALACEQEPGIYGEFAGVRSTRFIITADTYPDLKDKVLKTWLLWFPESEWGRVNVAEPMRANIRRPHPSGDGTIVDCEVMFLACSSADTVERLLASYEFTGFFRNEGQFAEKEIIGEFLSRTGRWPPPKSGVPPTWYGGFMDMNAPIEGHWIPYMRGDIPMPADWSDERKAKNSIPVDKETGKPTWRFYIQPPGLLEKVVDGVTTYQRNPMAENLKWLERNIPNFYVVKADGMEKEWIDRRIQNKVGLQRGGSAVYPDFSESVHVAIRDVPATYGATIIVGLDFGRDPAAAFCQCINGKWTVLSELIGDNESAEKFAPRVKRHLAQKYPGFAAEFWGDPRGADKGQNVEITAYDIFMNNGMRVLPATTDNNPEMRRSTLGAVLTRLYGLQVNNSCITLKTGLAGGYHYPKIKGTGLFADKPKKNRYSHIVEALENAVLGGGEGEALVRGPSAQRRAPSAAHRHSVRRRRAA